MKPYFFEMNSTCLVIEGLCSFYQRLLVYFNKEYSNDKQTLIILCTFCYHVIVLSRGWTQIFHQCGHSGNTCCNFGQVKIASCQQVIEATSCIDSFMKATGCLTYNSFEIYIYAYKTQTQLIPLKEVMTTGGVNGYHSQKQDVTLILCNLLHLLLLSQKFDAMPDM